MEENVMEFSECKISLSDLIAGLNSLDVNKGADPDKIPPIFLSGTASKISEPLLMIFNCFLATGTYQVNRKLPIQLQLLSN